MQSESLFLLSVDQWQAVEQINDALALPGDFHESVKNGLNIFQKTIARQEAALFLPRLCEHISRDWTFSSDSSDWEHALNEHRSEVYPIIARVLESGQPEQGIDSLQLSAILPIQYAGKTFGCLLIRGPAAAPGDLPVWKALARPFARIAALHAAEIVRNNGSQAYHDLVRSRDTLRAMFDSLPISIYIIDTAYNLVAVNLGRSNRVQAKPDQLVGGKCYERLYHRTTLCPGCRVGETFSAKLNTIRVNRVWLDNDNFEEWEISTFPIQDEKDQVIQSTIIEQDVTEKRNLEVNLIQSEKLAAVGQLAAGVAHEINNPLSAIIANAQILRREITSQDSDLLDSVKLIEMAGTRASQVVRNLLGIARKEKYEFEAIDLNETIQNALTLVQHELVGRPIQMHLDLADDLPPVLASRDQLQSVWINLLLNAIDALDKEMGYLSLSSSYTGKDFVVTIVDNGRGIPHDHLGRVFEPFYTTKSPGRGTGLGLSVCLRVIRHHGGNIEVDSHPGKWTRFTVHLPRGYDSV